MEASDVLDPLSALDDENVHYWLDGGWGVDRLLGEQSRPHSDLDLVLPRTELERVVALLASHGWAVIRDWLPSALAFRDGRGREVDFHAVEMTAAHTGLDALSPESQRYLLALTNDTASVESSTRQKFVDAASRGIQHHRNDSSALPRLLFLQRRELHLSLEDVAKRIGVPADQLAEVERGRERIDTLTGHKVASWISALGVGVDQARASLGRALELQRREDLAVAAAAAEVAAADDEFIDKVIALLHAEQR